MTEHTNTLPPPYPHSVFLNYLSTVGVHWGNNVKVVVVGFPACSLLTGRTRICISAGHTREDLEYAIEKLEEVVHKCFLRYGRSAIGA